MIGALGIDETAEIKQCWELDTRRVFVTQPMAEFGSQHPLGQCDLRSCGKSDDENHLRRSSQMTKNFYLDAVERVAGITNFCGMQIMSSTRMPYATAGRRTCSRREQTCARFRSCSAMWIWRPRLGISICRSDTCRQCRIRWSICNCPASARHPASIICSN